MYRCVRKSSIDKFNYIYNTGILQSLAFHHFIPQFNISHFKTEQWPIILQIEKLTITDSTTLSHDDRLKEALACVIIKKSCRRVGVELQDPAHNNVTIKDGFPIYFDFGSFIHGKDFIAYDPIVQTLILSLLLDYYPNSIFNKPIRGFKNSLNAGSVYLHYEAYIYYKNFLKYHRIHSNKIITNYIKDVFLRNNAEPSMILMLFGEGMDYEDFLKHYQ